MKEYDAEQEDWIQYSERLSQYFIANDIEHDNKKHAILLSICGPKPNSLIISLVAPEEPRAKSFDKLIKPIMHLHNPMPSVSVQYFKFNSFFCQPGLSMAVFATELHHLSEHHNSGATLNAILHDRLVCGINNERIQTLLAEFTFRFFV